MRPLFKTLCNIILALNLLPMLVLIGPVYGANLITGGYPGYPGVWSGLTTNTIMLINLDTPVAMIGTQPDMTYCVKKLSFSGFDYVFTDVACDAAAADDRKRVGLYPQALLDTSSPYAYHVVNINFQGGGSAQNFSQCYLTGDNPVIPPGNSVAQAALCTDYNYSEFNLMSGGNFCFKCHVGGYTAIGLWNAASYPLPTCTP